MFIFDPNIEISYNEWNKDERLCLRQYLEYQVYSIDKFVTLSSCILLFGIQYKVLFSDDLTVDYQFTFNLSKKEERHYTQINFRNTPSKPDIDADFSIQCSVLAKMNITVRKGTSKDETPIFSSYNCTTFHYRFSKSEYNFGSENNTHTTFYVYVYDFQPPLWIQISFSQYPKLNLQQFFITFSS